MVEITIYDAMGREVERLHRGRLEAGRHTFAWNGTNALGRHVAAGAYFLRASSPAASVTRRFVRLD
jgi:flagellar hook assembly protein FlgD